MMRNLLVIFTLVTFLIQPFPAHNQSAPLRRQTDEAKELEKLFDPIFAERMEKLRVPGAVVAAVKDGRIIFAKGYGVADVEKKTPVVADKTIFRIGSITKVFTANAVLQIADRWKINLHDDVNKYLKGVRVPDTYPRQPITFHHLLTHASGLDEISPGRRTGNEAELIPLGAFLKTRIVRRLPPGEVISYSTYNSALAGHIVEQITQTPFRQYVRENIFEPLEMRRTSFSNVPEELKADLATGYEYAENKHQKLPFQWFHTFPASDINSTATDMARFMLAHLAGGALPGGRRILSERMTREMHKTHFRNHPQIAGWAYGFYEGEFNNVRFIEHGGSMDDGYSALMTLAPEKNLGIFVACNTESGAFGLAGAVKNAFLNRYLPAPVKSEPKPAIKSSADDLKRFAGKYRPDIYCHTCAPGASYLPQPFEVKANDDGTLSFQGERWRRIEPLLFELINNPRAENKLLGFRENKNGEITYMFQDTYFVYEKVSP